MGAKADQMGAKSEPKSIPKFAPGPCAAHRRGVLGLGHSLRVTFPHAPFPRSRSGFCSILFFSRRIPSWIPPFPSLVGRFLVTLRALLVEVGSLIFRCVFWTGFLMIFDAFFAHFWDDFYMFFAYLFEQCFCLLFPRTFFKCMHTFKTRDLQNTLFFSSKNAIFEDPPLQKKFQNLLYWG